MPTTQQYQISLVWGYIVHSYYDLAFSSQAPGKAGSNEPLMTPVDCLVVNVLSKKVAPAEQGPNTTRLVFMQPKTMDLFDSAEVLEEQLDKSRSVWVVVLC